MLSLLLALSLPEALYMKIEGGFVEIKVEACEVQKVSKHYPFKATLVVGDEVRRGCWNIPEVEFDGVPMVQVVEEVPIGVDEVYYTIGTFAKYYFSPSK